MAALLQVPYLKRMYSRQSTNLVLPSLATNDEQKLFRQFLPTLGL